jgi:uncharacterized protein YkwD
MKTYNFKVWLVLACFTVLICNISCTTDTDSEENIENDAIDTEDVDHEETLTITEEILKLVNVHRASIGKQTLEFNNLANQLAKDHTEFMINAKEISHDSFSERADRLFDEENATNVGENVASGQRTAKDVMEAWLNSQGHRENIEGNFTHIGISAIKNDSGRYYYTQLFLKK